MPYKEKWVRKEYYTPQEVGILIRRRVSSLRFWEKKFRWLRPRRDNRGDRSYSREMIIKILKIMFLLRHGMTIDGISVVFDEGWVDDLIDKFKSKERVNLHPKRIKTHPDGRKKAAPNTKTPQKMEFFKVFETSEGVKMKHCPECSTDKEVQDFYVDKWGHILRNCKECLKEKYSQKRA